MVSGKASGLKREKLSPRKLYQVSAASGSKVGAYPLLNALPAECFPHQHMQLHPCRGPQKGPQPSLKVFFFLKPDSRNYLGTTSVSHLVPYDDNGTETLLSINDVMVICQGHQTSV